MPGQEKAIGDCFILGFRLLIAEVGFRLVLKFGESLFEPRTRLIHGEHGLSPGMISERTGIVG
jgi:hypothetical protein